MEQLREQAHISQSGSRRGFVGKCHGKSIVDIFPDRAYRIFLNVIIWCNMEKM